MMKYWVDFKLKETPSLERIDIHYGRDGVDILSFDYQIAGLIKRESTGKCWESGLTQA